MSAKSESFVTSTRFSDFDNAANMPFATPFGAILASNLNDSRNPHNLLLTFSSKINLTSGFERDTEDDIIATSRQVSRVVQGGFDMIFIQRREILYNLVYAYACLKHFQDLPYHYPRAIEGRLSMTDFAVRHEIFAYFDSHNDIDTSEIYKGLENEQLKARTA